MRVSFIVPYKGKELYQKDYDDILESIEGAGGTVLSPEKEKDHLYEQVIKQERHLHDPARAHYEFLRKSILDSDAVIIEASYEDFRGGHEATLALLYHKPVLALAQHINFGEFIHHPQFTGAQYTSGQAGGIVKAFLKTVASQHDRQTQARIRTSALHYAKSFSSGKTIAVFGGIYADIYNRVHHLPKQDEVILSSAFKMLLGGKATNTAVAMSRLGSEVIMLGHSGRDSLGDDLDALLLKEGVVTDFVTRDDIQSTGTVTMAVDDEAKANFIVNEGSNVHVDKAGIDELFRRVDSGRLHIDCLYLTLEAQPDMIDYVVREGHKRNIFIFCDAAPLTRPLNSKLTPLLGIVAPNQIEAEAMTGIKVTDEASARKAATHLIDHDGAKEVIITLGDQGMYHQAKDSATSVGWVPALKVTAIDETGAGDASRGALITELLMHHDRKKAMEYACRAGAFAVTRFGTYDSLPTHEELKFFHS